jgi:hypothetical protein
LMVMFLCSIPFWFSPSPYIPEYLVMTINYTCS